MQRLGDPLQAPQADVPLASLQAADVGPVIAKQVGEALLGQAAFDPDASQILSESELQLAFWHD